MSSREVAVLSSAVINTNVKSEPKNEPEVKYELLQRGPFWPDKLDGKNPFDGNHTNADYNSDDMYSCTTYSDSDTDTESIIQPNIINVYSMSRKELKRPVSTKEKNIDNNRDDHSVGGSLRGTGPLLNAVVILEDITFSLRRSFQVITREARKLITEQEPMFVENEEISQVTSHATHENDTHEENIVWRCFRKEEFNGRRDHQLARCVMCGYRTTFTGKEELENTLAQHLNAKHNVTKTQIDSETATRMKKWKDYLKEINPTRNPSVIWDYFVTRQSNDRDADCILCDFTDFERRKGATCHM